MRPTHANTITGDAGRMFKRACNPKPSRRWIKILVALFVLISLPYALEWLPESHHRNSFIQALAIPNAGAQIALVQKIGQTTINNAFPETTTTVNVTTAVAGGNSIIVTLAIMALR